MTKEELKELVRQVIQDILQKEIPIGISNRHIHLSEQDYERLFPNQPLQVKKYLTQPGEFASAQTVSIIGPKGKIDRVRVLAPLRTDTQVEISQTDARVLGVKAPIRMSGDLSNAAKVKIQTDFGEIDSKSCIVAKRHIHMTESDAAKFGVKPDDTVKVKITSEDRTTIYDDVSIRVSNQYALEMHVDTDEANAANVQSTTVGTII